jgi:hypothetical protein
MLVQTTEKLSLSASFTKSIIPPRLITNNQKLLRGELKNEGGKGRRVEGDKVRNSKVRLKASKPILHTNSSALYDFQHFAASAAESVHLKKPSGGPKGLIGPPCYGERR